MASDYVLFICDMAFHRHAFYDSRGGDMRHENQTCLFHASHKARVFRACVWKQKYENFQRSILVGL